MPISVFAKNVLLNFLTSAKLKGENWHFSVSVYTLLFS